MNKKIYTPAVLALILALTPLTGKIPPIANLAVAISSLACALIALKNTLTRKNDQ